MSYSNLNDVYAEYMQLSGYSYSGYERQMKVVANTKSKTNFTQRQMEASWVLSYQDVVSNLLSAFARGRDVLRYKQVRNFNPNAKYTPVRYNKALLDVQATLRSHGYVPGINNIRITHSVSSNDVERFINS